MAEESTEKELKLAGLKGIDTSNPDGGPGTNPILESSKDQIASSDTYIEPKTESQGFISDLANAGINGVTSDVIKGTQFTVDPIAKDLFTPIDLAIAIPDANERAEYIRQHGKKLYQLDPNVYGITFNKDIIDYDNFRRAGYHKNLKNFVDSLDENQGWLESLATSGGKLLGSTLNKIGGGILGTAYAMGSAFFNWDRQKLYDNKAYDFFDRNEEYINQRLVVYGGYDYGKEFDEQGNVIGQKPFLSTSIENSRFFDHPFKSINDDIVPTVSFVMGAVASEAILNRIGVTNLGATLARNAARVPVVGVSKFARAYKTIRGLEKLSDFQSMRRIASATNAIQKTLGTAGTMYRSAAYESAMIGKDTQDNTLLQAKFGYIKNNPALLAEYTELVRDSTDEFGNLLVSQEEIIEKVAQKIPKGQLALMKHDAKTAGTAAFLTNIPLVGASYMIQFPKMFGSSYRANQKILSKSGVLFGTTKDASGKLVADITKATRFEKLVFKYLLPSAKSGVTEAFEEFSQGVIEKGYSDYWSAPYTDTSVESSIGFLQAMGNASKKYVKSTEGIDSITLGFLMGIMGIPMVKQKASGRIGLGWSGGAYEAVQEVTEKLNEVEAAVKRYNDGPQINPVLKNNFESFKKSITIQEEKEKALEEGNVFAYKNAEFNEVKNFVKNRLDNGIADTITQDIDALEDMSLEEFNENFAHKDQDLQFTEETKKKNLENLRKTVNQIIQAQEETNTVFEDKRVWVDNFLLKDYKGLDDLSKEFKRDEKNQSAIGSFLRQKQQVLKDKVFDLLATTKNLSKREKELSETLREIVPNSNLDALLKDENYKEVLAAIEKGDKVYFAEEEGQKQLESFISEILNNIKENNFEAYNLNKEQIESIVRDLFKIKARKAKISEIYSVLFTNKGANKWLKLKEDLEGRYNEELLEAVREQAKKEVSKKQDARNLKAVLDNYRKIFKEDIPENSEKITEQLNTLKKKLSDAEGDLTYDQILQFLKEGKNTNLIEHIFEVLQNREQLPDNLEYSIDRMDDFKDDQEFKNNFLDAFLTIYNNFENVIKDIKNRKNFANKKVENIAPEPDNEGFAEDNKEAVTLDSLAEEIYEEQTSGVIPIINEKKLIFAENEETGKKELVGVLKQKDGKPAEWTDEDGNPSTQTNIPEYNMKLVNSPGWLSNKELEKEVKTATFKFSEDPQGDRATNSADDIGINVYHDNVFIGRLPRAGKDSKLKALREALYNGKVDSDGTILGKETTTTTQEYSGYQAVIVPAAPKTETTTETKPAAQIALEEKVEELKAKDKTFRNEDGSVPKENMEAWKQNKKDIQEAEENARRGNLPKGFGIPIRKLVPGDNANKVLQGEEAKKEEEKIEALIQEVLDGKKTAKEVIETIAANYAFFNNEMTSIKDYIRDRTTDAPEVGNNKAPFAVWRRGETEIKETTTSDIEARKKKLGINKNVLKIDSIGTTGSLGTKIRIQTPDGGILIIKPGTDSDLNFERYPPKGKYIKRSDPDPYDVVTLQDNFDEINEKEDFIPQKLVDILIKEASFKGKKQTSKNPQYTDIQKKIFAVSDKANITSSPDYGPTKKYREEILDPLSEFTDLFLKEIYEGEIKRHKSYIADIKKKGDESGKKRISIREEYIAVYENELAALETTTPETNAEIDNQIIADNLISGEFYYYVTDDATKPIRITAENVQEAIERNEIGDNIVDKKDLAVGKLVPSIEVPSGVGVIEFRGIQELIDALDKYKEDYTEEELNAIKQELEKLTALETTTPETEVEQTAREKVIENNFNNIIKALGKNPIMQNEAFIGQKQC